MFDGIKVTVWVKIGIFQQILYELSVSYLSDYIMEVDIISDWGIFHLPRTVEQKTHKPALGPTKITQAHTDYEFDRLKSLMRKEITTLSNALLEARVLVWTDTLKWAHLKWLPVCMKLVEVGGQKQCRDAWRKAPHKAGKYMKFDWYLQLWVSMITFLSPITLTFFVPIWCNDSGTNPTTLRWKQGWSLSKNYNGTFKPLQ